MCQRKLGIKYPDDFFDMLLIISFFKGVNLDVNGDQAG